MKLIVSVLRALALLAGPAIHPAPAHADFGQWCPDDDNC